MMQLLQSESTAARRRIPVYLMDDTDGKTPETGVTFSAGDIKISKDGGAEANHAGTVTELAGGLYYYEATAGELDTLGFLTARFVKSGVRTFVALCQVVAWNPYRGTLAKTTDITGFNDLSAAQVNAEVDAALDTAIPGSPTSGSINEAVRNLASRIVRRNTAQAGSSSSITLDASASATDDFYNDTFIQIVSGTGVGQTRHIADYSGSSKVAVTNPVWAVTPDNTSVFQITAFAQVDVGWWANQITDATDIAIKGTLAKGTDITGFNDLSAAAVNAEVDTALSDVNLDHLVGTATGIPALPADTFLDQILDDGTATYNRTTDSLQAIRDTPPIGTAMRGTDNAALASVCTEGRLSELEGANLPADVDQIKADLPGKVTKNVALANFEFVMVDSTDHVTGKTGLTITAERSIDGAAFGACANAAAEVGAGVYKIDLAASDLNGNVVTLKFTGTGADATLVTVVTQPT